MMDNLLNDITTLIANNKNMKILSLPNILHFSDEL